ncbi:MAG: GMC family oxidoreductase [Gammaproteobacteria bacterium]|nr:GMC family oxidoreductase [Gammaproteobacteria bacterium]
MGRLVDNLEALDATEPYDVCVVGAGLAGSILGLRFAQAGLRVLLLESGGGPRHWLLDPRLRQLGAVDVGGDTAYPGEPLSPRMLGGGSRVWSGVCERFEPEDFRPRPYLPAGNAWPLSYGDLAPHYSRAEKLFRVRGGSRRTSRERPLPRLRGRRADTAFQNLVEKTGVTVRPAATATASGGTGAFDLRREVLPEFVASRTATLVSGVTATRLRADRNGRIIGVNCRTLDGAKKFARADTFILCCGAVQTPRLLLLSRSPRFPGGIGNDHDRVGRRFTDQAILTLHAEVPRGAPPGPLGRPHDAYAERCHRAFRRHGLGAVHPVFSHSLRVARMLGGGGLGQWLDVLRAPLEPTLTIRCRVETKPVERNRVTLSRTLTDPFGDPLAHLRFDFSAEDVALLAKTRALLNRWVDRCGGSRRVEAGLQWAGAAAGTCAMGTDPLSSVCDPTLRVHASPNLYLCGAEAFPLGGALPPALTIAALAERLSDHVIARARWCSRAAAIPKPRRPMPSEPAPTVALVRREPQS